MGQTLILMISDPFYVIFYFFGHFGKNLCIKKYVIAVLQALGNLISVISHPYGPI